MHETLSHRNCSLPTMPSTHMPATLQIPGTYHDGCQQFSYSISCLLPHIFQLSIVNLLLQRRADCSKDRLGKGSMRAWMSQMALSE